MHVDQLLRVQHRCCLRILNTGGRDQNVTFLISVGIVDIDLQQEPVELRFGQWIGSLLLDRVLGRENVEWLIQNPVFARHGDPMLLHRLQERRLGPRAGPVDLIREKQPGKDRPLDEFEHPCAFSTFLEHFGAQNVRRHQIRRELDMVGIQPQNRAHRVDQSRLREAGNADQKRVTAGQDRRQAERDHILLANDPLCDLGACAGQRLACGFNVGNEVCHFGVSGISCAWAVFASMHNIRYV